MIGHSRDALIPGGDRHIGLFQTLLIGVAFGFIVAWFAVAAWLLVAVLAYGLFGLEPYPLSFRAIAFVFSVVFVIVTAAGIGFWLDEKVRSFLNAKTNPKAQGEG